MKTQDLDGVFFLAKKGGDANTETFKSQGGGKWTNGRRVQMIDSRGMPRKLFQKIIRHLTVQPITLQFNVKCFTNTIEHYARNMS